MREEIICTACPRHCVIGILTFTDPPKDSPPKILKSDGSDLIEYCKQNYLPAENH